MGLFDKMADSFLQNFLTFTEPKFLKDFSKENQQLDDLLKLSETLKDGEKKDAIDKDIINLRAGIEGEGRVYNELKNSFIPFIGLHDVRLEYKGCAAQFDFIVITNKFICVLESKKLYGNIIINKDGDFIRMIKQKNGATFREGIYSPITQNERHSSLFREMLLDNEIIKHTPVKSLVVFANDKTIIDKRECPVNISCQIYKYDQIKTYLNEQLNDKDNIMDIPGKNMLKIARFILENHKPIAFDNIAKYRITEEDFLVGSKYSNKEIEKEQQNKEGLREKLKEYRLLKSREENIKAFYIYNNNQMEDLIHKKPQTIEDLLKVNGFGEAKVKKYGNDILDIFKWFS
ncbi:hypothetical protein BHU72_01950 [Desulfuribacillus stibiiarsenatis]|uniref:HRDC domain-containing protein n=1 Tax=Desulfuribacillus stibiiarsenatis TaxID=1390249 RepID=A0A1E5L650_9FIRM|nr:NERD domain-containing protein [Desulfuribacillus stibiiarsenatis]OEH85586.1 hypothetical protein BHU72_01950 [Desulfuribacillus stibiiarsenatis]